MEVQEWPKEKAKKWSIICHPATRHTPHSGNNLKKKQRNQQNKEANFSLLLYLTVSDQKFVPTFFCGFRYIILASSTVATLLKYGLHTVDVVMDGEWDSKAVYIFYLELIRDLVHLSVYFVFFLIVFM